MTTPTFWDNVLEFFYVLIGLQLGYTSYKAFTDQTNQKRIGTGLFWLDLGLLFALGKVLPTVVSGVLVVFLGIVTIINQFEVGKFANFSMDALVANAKRYRNWVFFPVLCLAIVSMLLAKFIPDSSKVAIGFAAVIGTVFAWLIFRGSFKATMAESDRMIQSMGTSGVLPQLLAALGVIFSISGRDSHCGCNRRGRTRGESLLWRRSLCLRHGLVYRNYGQRLCGFYGHYCRHRYSICHCARC